MIIDRLPALPSAPATGDKLAIGRGTGAYKIDYNALASAIIAQTQRDIAIVVEGNKTTHTGGAAVGAYVIVHNSTISGIADGLYKAIQAIPQNTAITSAYLEAVSGGGLNVIAHNDATSNQVVNLIGYTNPQAPYTFPYDGYVRIDSGPSDRGYTRVVIRSPSGEVQPYMYMNVTGSYQMQSMFVKGGMRCYILDNTASSTVTYYPLTK